MKNNLFIVALSACFLFTSCANQENKSLDEIEFFKNDPDHQVHLLAYIQNVKTDWGKLGLRGKVKSMEETVNDWEYRYTFGNDGKITEMQSNAQGYEPAVNRYIYDTKTGRLLRIESESVAEMYSNGKTTKEKRNNTETIEYDDKGKLIGATYDNIGALQKYREFHYQPDGYIVAFGRDSLYRKYYQYNPDGTYSKVTYLEQGMDDDYDYVREYTYNTNRDVERENIGVTTIPPAYAKEARSFNSYTLSYAYEYDTHGNWTKKTITNEGQVTGVHTRTIEYYK